jgi:hypothetical protein
MQGRAFLELARELVLGTEEVRWRATVIHAYYALILECREALTRWRIAIPPRQSVHSVVRLRFLYAADPTLNSIGRTLDQWCRYRNDASYNLKALPDFASDRIARLAILEVFDALTLLDAIESDLVRRAAAIASFPP